MESGPPPTDRPGDGDQSEAPPPGGPPGPPPVGPQAPGPGGPQAPAPGPQAPQFPAPPARFSLPTDSPEEPAALRYGGPTPPGGWQAPLSDPRSAWAGRPLASWGSRVAASLLDWLIVTVPLFAVGVVVAIIAASGSGVGAVVFFVIAGLAVLAAALLYAPLLMGRQGPHNGQTWGKQIIGIAVIRNAGQPVDVGFAFLREFVVKGLLFGGLGSLLFYIPTLLDVLWPLWDDENRCLHDMVVSTHVVRVGD